VTVIKMMHITIASFHINLIANKSYLLDADPPETLLTPTNSKSWTIHHVVVLSNRSDVNSLPNPAYVNIAPCSCDLTPAACDVNCCCDAVSFNDFVSFCWRLFRHMSGVGVGHIINVKLR